MNDLEDPQKFVMAGIVTKNSKTGFTSNKRLLVIKRGHLYYYSNVPKKYKDDVSTLDSLQQIPKCSIQISNIKKINGLQNNSNNFSIQFQDRYMMEKQDIKKTMTLQSYNFAPKNTKQSVTWQFTCDNSSTKQNWVKSLQTLKKHFNKQKVNIQKFFDNIKKQQKQPSSPAIRSSVNMPWRQDQMKKNGSNQSLRKSQMSQSLNSSKLSVNKSPSPNSKKSVFSQQKFESKQLKKSSSFTSQEIVQSFIKLQKTKSALQLNTPPIIVQQRSQNQRNSQEIAKPSKEQLLPLIPKKKQTILQKLQINKIQENSQQLEDDGPIVEDKMKILRKQTIDIQNFQRPVTPQKRQIKNQISVHQIVSQYEIQNSSAMNQNKSSQILIDQQKQTRPNNNILPQPLLSNWSQPKIQPQPQPQTESFIQTYQPYSQKYLQQQQKQNKSINDSDMSNHTQFQQNYKQLKTQPIHEPQNLKANKQVVGRSKQLNLTKQLNLLNGNKKKISNGTPKYFNFNNSHIEFKVTDETNFYELLYFACNRQYSFDKRIDTQKRINAKIGSFTDKSLKSFSQFVNSKRETNQRAKGRFIQQKINDNISNLQIGYTRFKISYVNTQTILINGKKKVFYNQVPVKELKRQIKIYNQILYSISNQIKNINLSKSSDLQNSLQMSLSQSRARTQNDFTNTRQILNNSLSYPLNLKYLLLKLRTPLCTYIEYKGISAIAYDQTFKNQQKQITDKQALKQWKQAIKYLGYDSNCFKFKSLTTKVGQVVLIYLISATKDIYLNQKQKKHHNVTFQSPMNVQFLKKARKEGASTSAQSLLRYIKTISQIKDTSMFVCTREQITTTLQYCYLCKYLRKFYRAAHSQIDQLKFINLLLRGDSNINSLFESSGFQFQPLKQNKEILGIFFQFLLYYLGYKCQINFQKFKKAACLVPLGIQKKKLKNQEQQIKIVKSVKVLPRIIGYNLQIFEVYQSFSKLSNYILNKSKQLAYKSLQIKQSIFFDHQFQLSSYPWPAFTQCLYNSAQLNFIQNDFITSITKSKQFLSTISPLPNDEENKWVSPTPSCCLPVYFLMMKSYSKFSREKFNQILKQAIQSTIFNFGQQSPMIMIVFSFAAVVFYGIGLFNQAQNFLKVGIKIGEKIFSKYRKLRLSELYIDLYKVYLHQNKNKQANQYFLKAQKLIQNEGLNQQKLNLELQSLQAILKFPKSIQKQEMAMQILFKAQTMIKRSQPKVNTLRRYYNIIYHLGVKYSKRELCEKVIQELWKLDTNCKILAIQNAFKMVNNRIEWNLIEYQSIVQRWSQSKQKSILKIQQSIKNYKNLLEMISQVFLEHDEELISAFLLLLPPVSVKPY